MLLLIVFAQSCMKFRISDDAAKKIFEKSGTTLITEKVTINDFEMHYAKSGNDSLPTLFFIHGSPGSWDAFSKYMMDSELLQKFRMVSIDRPGFGYSSFGNAKTLAEQSLLITAIVAKLKNNKPAYLVGHSLGGPLCIQLYSDAPQNYQGIVLLAASVDPDEEKPEKWRIVLMNTPLNLLIPGALRPSNEELWYLKKDLVDLKPLFAKIDCPVWIIHGKKDGLVPVGNAAYAKQMLTISPSVNVQILPDANHFLPWQQYELVKKTLFGIY